MASFGCDDLICKRYHDLIEKGHNEEGASLQKFAFLYGLGQFIQNVVFGILYYIQARIVFHYPSWNGEKMWLSLFAIMFGAFSAGNATAFGPDVKKATAAAQKVFTVTNHPSEIDPMEEDDTKKIKVDKEAFKGDIEFRDVWFRYPTRRE